MPPRVTGLTRDQRKIRFLYEEGYTDDEIGAEIHLSASTVRRRRKLMGLPAQPTRSGPAHHAALPSDELLRALALHNQGLKYREIAERLGLRSHSAAWERVQAAKRAG